MDLLLTFPAIGVIVLFVAAFVALACLGHVVVRRRIPYRALVAHNDVAGFMIAIVGVLYSVLLAFVVVIVWQQYNDSDARYADEVGAIADLHQFVRELPGPQMRAIPDEIDRYVDLVVKDEWPAMQRGGSSPAAREQLAKIIDALVTYRPASQSEILAQRTMLDFARRALDDRRQRIVDNGNTVPSIVWFALLLGATITIGFGYLFGVQRFRVQLLMTAAVAALIALSFAVIVELDLPFRGGSALSAQRWLDFARSENAGPIDRTRQHAALP